MDLTLTVLTQLSDFQTPFDVDALGFTEGWWDHRVGRARDQHSDFLSFTLNGNEVARAEVDRGTINNIYVGLTPAPEIVDVVFFEVRESRRRAGVGRAAIALIERRYDGEMLIAFSEEADDFWSGIGWTHYPRADRSPHHRPLFVSNDALRS